MKITAVTAQARNKNRVNVYADGIYRFSLDIFQVGELNLRIGDEYTPEELDWLKSESEFGKLYTRAKEYCLMRPHSSYEIKRYLKRKLYRKAVDRTEDSNNMTADSNSIAERVYERLQEKGLIDDDKFAQWWVATRKMRAGVSVRKLQQELRTKGVSSESIDTALRITDRSDVNELQKVIQKKQHRYADTNKFIAYLLRQGFSYDDIKQELEL